MSQTKETEEVPYSTGVRKLDDLLLGGWKKGLPYVLFGAPKAGKTWMSYQTSVLAAQRGINVVYIDTESFWIEQAVNDMYWKYFKDRFRVDDEVRKRIHIVQAIDLFSLGTMFGMDILLSQNEASISAQIKYPKREGSEEVVAQDGTKSKKPAPPKSSEQWKDWYERSPIYKMLQEEEAGMLIVDSLTAPIKDKIPFARQNIPAARNPVQNAFLSVFRTISFKLNIPVIFTAHSVRDQTNQADPGQPWGGADVTYFIKRQMGILGITGTEWKILLKEARQFKDYRRFYRSRYPGLMEAFAYGILEKDTGFIDVPDPIRGPG